jgi:hypothetical protein
MHRTALFALGALLASAGLAAGQGLPEGTFASTKEGCAKLKRNTAAELGQDLDFIVLSKAGINANLQRCDFVTVTARNATSWLATAFCEEPAYAYPDLFAVILKENGDLRITRMTVQQASYDEADEEPVLSADDLDPAEIGRGESAASEDSPAFEEEAATDTQTAEDSLDTYFRCENVKP